MSKTFIYVALILRDRKLINDGTHDVINLINKQFPNNYVIIKEYITKGTINEIKLAIDDFVSIYPSGNRITISYSTTILKYISEYIYDSGLDIPSISFSASSPTIRTFKNVLTYCPIDKYAAMSQFLIYKDYQMEQIKVLFELNDPNFVFLETYLEEIKIQANLLDIELDVEYLVEGKNNYNIKPKSFIIILAGTISLTTKFINNEFLNNIPPECYILLTDYNKDIGDIFGDIPAIIINPFPIDYTETSSIVYQSLTNKATNFFSVYTFYDVLYSLVYFTGTNLNLTLENLISINPFQSGVFPAFIATQSNLTLKLKGIDFGQYTTIFTKNSLVQNDNLLFEKYNKGGILSSPNSNSIFKNLGIVPFFNVNIFYGDEDYYKIFDECGNLIVTRFSSNITNYPDKNNVFFNIGQHCNNRFYCKYTQDNYFSYLEAVNDAFNNKSIVNLTMGKTPFLKVISNE
jgi:hypothetical protein